jgi:hypothetical protein
MFVPRLSRESVCSFSSDGRRGKDSRAEAGAESRAEAIRVNKRLTASTSAQELVREITASHRGFNNVNVSTAWRKLARLMRAPRTAGAVAARVHGGNKDIGNALRLLSEKTTHLVQAMKSQNVANSLWAFGKLTEAGVEVEMRAVRAVSLDGAVRVAGKMIPQEVANSLWAFGKLAEAGADVEARAVRAVSLDGAVRVAGEMNPQGVAMSLWAFGKLAEKGADVETQAVRAVSLDGAVRVAGEMNPQDVAMSLWAFGKLAEAGADVETRAVRAVRDEVSRVAGEMNPQHVVMTLWAFSALVANGLALSSILDKSSWLALVSRTKTVQGQMSPLERGVSRGALDIITRASLEGQTRNAEHETEGSKQLSKGASSAFWALGERWLSKLPEGKRTKLRTALMAAETDAAKVELLVASAEADATKVRAAAKRALLEAVAAETFEC